MEPEMVVGFQHGWVGIAVPQFTVKHPFCRYCVVPKARANIKNLTLDGEDVEHCIILHYFWGETLRPHPGSH